MTLVARMKRLERLFGGGGGGPRSIVTWFSPMFQESWVESAGGILRFYVQTPDHEADPLEHLTPEMRALIRPHDRIVAFHAIGGRRRRHPQHDRPPWKRRPFRRDPDGRSYELQNPDGSWERFESH